MQGEGTGILLVVETTFTDSADVSRDLSIPASEFIVAGNYESNPVSHSSVRICIVREGWRDIEISNVSVLAT